MARQMNRSSDTGKISTELFALTYGAFVSELVNDIENDDLVNKKLEHIGHNIGCRLIEDFCARNNQERCSNLKDTANIISKVAFKQYLNVEPFVTNWSENGESFSLIFSNDNSSANPLVEYLELPEEHKNLNFSAILCGVIKGALEMLQIEVEANVISDLSVTDTTDIKVKFIKRLDDIIPVGDD